MNKKLIALLMILCFLPCSALANITLDLNVSPQEIFLGSEYVLYGDEDVQLPQKYFDRTQNIYRPISYITMAADGTQLSKEIKVEHVATVTYRCYYTINGEGEYVSGGVSSSNGFPSVTAVNFDKFGAVATPGTDPVWSVSAYPDHSGLSYTINGGFFTLTCNHTIYVDPDGNFIVGVPSDIRLLYTYNTTYP